MTALKATKRALLSSALALVLCFAMLLGTTFAWFTDTAISANNKIVTGTLDVELYQWTNATAGDRITNSSDPVFGTDIIWEPGMTQVRYLSIKNEGSLALKYKVALQVSEPANQAASLADVMSYAIAPDAVYNTVTAWDAANAVDVELGYNTTAAEDVELAPGAEHFFAISIHMDEQAGNEYQNKEISFDIKVLAGQLASEKDSFGKDYDALAGYPGTGYATIEQGQSAAEIEIKTETNFKVGSITVPKDAAADTEVSANVVESNYNGNFTIDGGIESVVYDITVDGLKDDNTVPVKVKLLIAPGLDPNTVKVYHYDTEIAANYDPNYGYVTFETTNFSPFTILFDAESEYVAPEIKDDTVIPSAKVEYLGVNAGEETIAWGSYGQWSPTAGLDSTLEATFKFSCPEEIDEAFRYWNCDFYVSLDRDLGANQLFLGGNYGSFGWVGFHNGDLELEANTEIGLLESVTTNPWSYDDVENFVGTFICGVGDVNNALEGATFTVKLRLTNPTDAAEYYDVNVVTYTFGGDYVIK